jgi:endoribonuclease Nob1
MEETGKKAIVLDTSAFVAGFDPFSIGEEQFTVPMVKEEMVENSMACLKFRIAEESGKLTVKTPENDFIEKVKESATTVGDAFFLSEPDTQVLALALQLKMQGYTPLVATDDYSIQNVADRLGIKFASLATFGIRRQLQWIRYCPACRKKYPANYQSRTCEVCGTKLKRKPLRKTFTKVENDGEKHEFR